MCHLHCLTNLLNTLKINNNHENKDTRSTTAHNNTQRKTLIINAVLLQVIMIFDCHIVWCCVVLVDASLFISFFYWCLYQTSSLSYSYSLHSSRKKKQTFCLLLVVVSVLHLFWHSLTHSLHGFLFFGKNEKWSKYIKRNWIWHIDGDFKTAHKNTFFKWKLYN